VCGSISKGSSTPGRSPTPGARTSCASRSTVTSTEGSASTSANSCRETSSLTGAHTMPTFPQFVRKMSAKLGATMAVKPASSSAHGACSREDPHPKLRPASSTFAPACWGWFMGNSGLGVPSSSYRHSANANGPKPVRSMRLRYCFGTI
jgi:hypothetical protein